MTEMLVLSILLIPAVVLAIVLRHIVIGLGGVAATLRPSGDCFTEP